MQEVITYEELTKAIVNNPRFGGDMSEEGAKHLSKNILNFFGYMDRIIDNVLDPDTRNMFYMLEDASLLTTEREETTLYDGREWRVHYWLFRRDLIMSLAEAKPVVEKEEEEAPETIYDIDDSIWERGTPEEE